ncbi:MAG: aldo/keto reductase [Bacteroidales bacterium]
MKKEDRRSFLKSSLAGLSGAALLRSDLLRGLETTNSASATPGLPSRVLGKTGLSIPLISLGAGNSSASGFVRGAYESGVKMFFSATYYGEGNNERLVGEGLKGLPRDSFLVGSAVPPDGLDMRSGKFLNGFDGQAYMKKTEECLKRFGLDYIDFFLFPFAGKKEMVLNEEVLKVMEQIKKKGMTRYLGIASHSDMEEALNSAAGSGVYDIAMISYNFKTGNLDSLDKAIENAAKSGMGIVAMKTTAGAYRNKSGPQLNSDAALKWVLQNKNISSIVSGMSSLEELNKNLKMINDLKMTDQDKKDLNLAIFDHPEGIYCQQCRECVPQCKANLDIPTIMRSYMYAYGYHNLPQAWHTYIATGSSSNPCSDCNDCAVRCISGFDVKGKVSDISRLSAIPGDLVMV